MQEDLKERTRGFLISGFSDSGTVINDHVRNRTFPTLVQARAIRSQSAPAQVGGRHSVTNKRAIGGMSAKLAWLTCSLTALAIVAIVGQSARTAGGTFHECLK